MGLAEAVASGWSAAQTAVLVVAGIAIIGGVLTATLTYLLSQRAARRERRATAFAQALAAVEDYAEMPYRIRRRLDAPGERHHLTEEISAVQTRLAYYQALLEIEAPLVAEAYRGLVQMTKSQAGEQMKSAWKERPFTSDGQMNLVTGYPRGKIDQARDNCIAAMRKALHT